MLGVYTRSGPDTGVIDTWQRLATSVLAPLAGFASYALAVRCGRFCGIGSRLWLPPVLWFSAGVLTSLFAAALRGLFAGESSWSALNLLTGGLFTALSIVILTVGTFSLSDGQRQRQILAARTERLVILQNRAQSYVRSQTAELLDVIARIVTPEIDHLRAQIESVGPNPGRERLRQLQQEVSRHSTNLVRQVSHELAPTTHTVDGARVSQKLGLREVLHLASGARVNSTLTVLAAALLFIAQFNLGCGGVPATATAAFLIVTLSLGALGRFGVLQRGPYSLLWLVVSGVVGFAAYRFVIAGGPPECAWARNNLESGIAAVLAVLGYLGLTILVEASRQAAHMVEDLQITNEGIAAVTQRFNMAGALTNEQVSKILHGPIQGKFAAVSLALQIHLEELEAGGRPSSSELQRRVVELLDEASHDLLMLEDVTAARWERADTQLANLGRYWQGFLDVEVDVDEGAQDFLGANAHWITIVIQCAEEAITNASRHGGGRNVRVQLELQHSTRLLLRVTDDGQGLDTDMTPGFGLSAIAKTGGTWKLSPRATGGAELLIVWTLP